MPEAATNLRYFYEQCNEIHVMAASSLLETFLDRTISFPVGRVEYHFLFPLSFTEYLLAANETESLRMLAKPCPEYAHAQLLKLFHQYVLVGEMPEAVSAFLPEQDIVAVNQLYRDLTIGFMDDGELCGWFTAALFYDRRFKYTLS